MLPLRNLLFIIAFLAAIHMACSRSSLTDNSLRFVSTIAGANGEFGDAFGVAVKDGDVYVSDGQNGTIWKVHDGKASAFWDQLDTPSGLAFMRDGRLVVTDAGRNQVLVTYGGRDVSGNAYGYGGGDHLRDRGFAEIGRAHV